MIRCTTQGSTRSNTRPDHLRADTVTGRKHYAPGNVQIDAETLFAELGSKVLPRTGGDVPESIEADELTQVEYPRVDSNHRPTV